MNNKNMFDKFITQEPEDNFTPWCEMVVDKYSLEFYDKNVDSFIGSELENNWLNKIYDMGYEPRFSAYLIEICFKVTVNK